MIKSVTIKNLVPVVLSSMALVGLLSLVLPKKDAISAEAAGKIRGAEAVATCYSQANCAAGTQCSTRCVTDPDADPPFYVCDTIVYVMPRTNGAGGYLTGQLCNMSEDCMYNIYNAGDCTMPPRQQSPQSP